MIRDVYTLAKEAQKTFLSAVSNQRNLEVLKTQSEDFEDDMNGMSGEILGLELKLQQEIQNENQFIFVVSYGRGIRLHLHQSILPETKSITDSKSSVLAKKLYPRTESVQVQQKEDVANTNTEITDESSTSDPIIISEDLPSEDTVDQIFDDIDAEAATGVDEYAPLSTEQNETIPYIADDLIEIAKEAAANTDGLQSGLTSFSYNPLAGVIQSTKSLLLYYTESNYANLNVALAVLYSDPLLADEFKEFENSIGGNDGLSSCVSQLDNFKDHTDRLSGLVLDSNSPNTGNTDNSTVDNLAMNDFSGGPTLLFSFDSRKFRSAKYTVQASADITDRGHQVTELYILHDNHHAYTHESTPIYSQEPFVTYTTRLLNSNVEVFANTTAVNTNFVIYGTRLKIAKDSKIYPEMSQQAIIQIHENISAILNDGVDYVSLMSASLLKSYLVANLAREFSDFLVNLTDPVFLAQSTAQKQAALISAAAVMLGLRNSIQSSIDLDWQNFRDTRKLQESLDIAYNLTVSYTDAAGNTIPSATLNTRTIQAIKSTSTTTAADEE
jgi:hypothetical protein